MNEVDTVLELLHTFQDNSKALEVDLVTFK